MLQPEADAVRARRAILDAMIRRRTWMPLIELLPFFDQFPAAVIAIVAKNPNEGEDRLSLLLKAEQGKNSIYWYAAASLVDRKQLIHYLVQQARFDYAISVSDQDFVPAQVFDRSPGVVGGIIGGVMPGIPNGSQVAWPETTIYHIEMSGDIDRVLTCCFAADPLTWEDHDRDLVRMLLSIAACIVCQNSGDFPNVRG